MTALQLNNTKPFSLVILYILVDLDCKCHVYFYCGLFLRYKYLNRFFEGEYKLSSTIFEDI